MKAADIFRERDGIPCFVLGGQTPRQWRALKRWQARRIVHMIDEYRYGCAYAPGQIGELAECAKTLIAALSVKKWKR